jgi:hypothetical protein
MVSERTKQRLICFFLGLWQFLLAFNGIMFLYDFETAISILKMIIQQKCKRKLFSNPFFFVLIKIIF